MTDRNSVSTQRPESVSDMAVVAKAKEILADYDAGRPLQTSGDGWLVRFATAIASAGSMSDCERCGSNHYDMTRPRVPTCPFKPQRTGPGGLREHEIDRDIKKILAMTDGECRQAGIAEFGNEAAWRKAMGELKVKMLKAAGIPEQEGASEALPEPRSGDTSKPSPQEQGEEPTVDEIVAWFNAWLATPIDARDRVIIESMLRHVRNYPRQINEDAIRALRTPVEPVLPSEASTSPSSVDDAEVMRIWRECGLPEYFLGNGGSNHKLVAFAKACSTSKPSPQEQGMRMPTEAIEQLRNHQTQLDMDGIMVGVSRQAIDEVLTYLDASPSPEQGIREALEYALKSMKAMRGVIDEAPAETWGVDGMGGEEAHLQTWWPKQEEYLHYADQDIAVVEAALSSVGRGGGESDPLRQAAAHLCAFDWESATSPASADLNARILALRAALSEGTHRT